MEQKIFNDLALRLGREMLSKRLTRQVRYATHLYSQGGYSSFHLENFKPLYTLLKALLKATGQYRQARQNTMDYRVEINHVQMPKPINGLKNFQILQITDLHLDAIPDKGKKLSQLIKNTEADLLVITGDFRFHDYGDYYEISKLARDFVSGFDFPHGMYGILGNHDFIEVAPLIEDLGIRLLLNEKEILDINGANLLLAGIDDAHFYGCHQIPPINHQPSSTAIKILLSHTPETYREAKQAGYDLILCGHTHGGQVCLPGQIPLITNAACPNKYCSGAWSYDSMQGYTSRGAGASGLPIRMFCPPEITIHRFV